MEQYYTADNTEGYTQEQLDALNADLATRLTGVEPHTDEWTQIIKAHNDEIAGR